VPGSPRAGRLHRLRRARLPGGPAIATRPVAELALRHEDEDLAVTTDVRLRPLLDAVRDPYVKVVSVDVFDTMLWRMVAEPVDAFPLVGRRLLERGVLAPHISPYTFDHVRQRAEWQARGVLQAEGGGVEVDLARIYAEVPPHVLRAGAAATINVEVQRAAAIDVEVQVEKELLLPDLDVAAVLAEAQDRGKRLVAVSDTYFSEQQLRELLDVGPLAGLRFERIFASSAHGVGKGHGLFDLVLAELEVDAAAVVHLGDNLEADVRAPQRVGLRVVHLERRTPALHGVLLTESSYLVDPAALPESDLGLTGIRSKIEYRGAAAALPEELQPFWRYGAAHLGPVLTGFAEWIHRRAQEAGVDKAFCLMREGAVLADLVDVAGTYLDSDVHGERTWLSRQVCARASIREGTREELQTLLTRRRMPTVSEFCSTLGLDVTAVPGLADHREGRLNDPALAETVLSALTSDPQVRSDIVASSRALRGRVVRYVQSLVPDGGCMVLVDLGWAGSIQGMLQQILLEEQVPITTVGLYLVTSSSALARVMQGADLDGFLIANGDPEHESAAILRSPEILEQVCMPDFGSQTGLTADLEPVLAGPGADAGLVQSIQRDTVQKGVFAFQREWARYAAFLPGRLPRLDQHGHRLLRATLTRTVAAPTEAEARIFSTWVHDENYGSEGTDTIVGSGIVRALRHLDPAGLIAVPMGELYWPFGLAALRDEHLAHAAEQVAMGRLPVEAVSSVVEAGNFEVFVDGGMGYSEAAKAAVQPRRNRFGLTYVSATLRGPELRTVRIDPVNDPAVLRIDWLSVRCWVRGADVPVELVLDTPELLGRLTLTRCSWLRPKLLLVDSPDPHLELDLQLLFGAPVYEVTVQCAYAALPVAPTGPGGAQLARASLRRRLRGPARIMRGVEHRTGLPLERALRKAYRTARGA